MPLLKRASATAIMATIAFTALAIPARPPPHALGNQQDPPITAHHTR